MKVHLEHLVGSEVRDTRGKRVGRVMAVLAVREGKECIVTEYHLGSAAFIERLGLFAGRLVGLARRQPLRVPWDQLDLTDERKPRLRCTREEIEEKR